MKDMSPSRIMIAVALAAMTIDGSTMAGETKNSPMDKPAMWRMDGTGAGSGTLRLASLDAIRFGEHLTGGERAESLAHGGDGVAAVARDALRLVGVPAAWAKNQMTVHARVKFPVGWEANRLLFQCGPDDQFTFRLYSRSTSDPKEIVYYCQDPGRRRCAVLEFELRFAKTGVWRVSAPFAMFGPGGWHDITAVYDGPRIALYVDGVLVDEEWPVGDLTNNPGNRLLDAYSRKGAARAGSIEWKSRFDGVSVDTALLLDHVAIWNRVIDEAERMGLCGGAEWVRQRDTEILGPQRKPGQYWTPRDYNGWVGDVMTLYHGGRFHVFFLYYRKYADGGRKQHVGAANAIMHLSSEDLKQWTQHSNAFDIEEQWETPGTGYAFVHEGKVILTYGNTTSHYLLSIDDTFDPIWDNEFQATGMIRPYTYDQILSQGIWPIGASYLTSEDGMHFKKSRIAFHPSQNPTVIKWNKGYMLLAGFPQFKGYGGRWVSETPFGPWRRDPAKSGPPVWYECNCQFEWNGKTYYIGGRDGLVGGAGNLYDGTMVPMVSAFKDNRRILAAQSVLHGNGGFLVFRELVSLGDRLGLKWPAELVQECKLPLRDLPWRGAAGTMPGGDRVHIEAGESFQYRTLALDGRDAHISMRVVPKTKDVSFGVCALGKGDYAEGCELRFSPAQDLVRWGTPRNGRLSEDENRERRIPPWVPGSNYALTVPGLGQPFQLQLIVKRERKGGYALVDAMIDERQTLLTRRVGLDGNDLFMFAVNGQVSFEDITIRPLADLPTDFDQPRKSTGYEEKQQDSNDS
jgi:hypothetical protein